MLAQPETHANVPTVPEFNSFVYVIDDDLDGRCSNVLEGIDSEQ